MIEIEPLLQKSHSLRREARRLGMMLKHVMHETYALPPHFETVYAVGIGRLDAHR